MSQRDFKAIFERFTEPDDAFGALTGTWEEVAREWVGLKSMPPNAKGEIQDTNQTKALATYIADCCWSQTMDAAVDTSCRLKLSRPTVVDESEPNSDANFRIFNIADIVNVNEMNRELQFMVVERV